ncbi:hypothetical protein QE435_001392 [Rhizobium sp. SORGH_AS 787]|nr:hypothetical protein [Rhizobium sp. SORGH_AS_0787]
MTTTSGKPPETRILPYHLETMAGALARHHGGQGLFEKRHDSMGYVSYLVKEHLDAFYD